MLTRRHDTPKLTSLYAYFLGKLLISSDFFLKFPCRRTTLTPPTVCEPSAAFTYRYSTLCSTTLMAWPYSWHFYDILQFHHHAFPIFTFSRGFRVFLIATRKSPCLSVSLCLCAFPRPVAGRLFLFACSYYICSLSPSSLCLLLLPHTCMYVLAFRGFVGARVCVCVWAP